MSVLQNRGATNTPDLQIWNNAAFDNGDSEDSSTIKASWSQIDSASSKENQSPVLVQCPISLKSPAPIKPLHPNATIGNTKKNPVKLISKQGLEVVRDEKKIDSEIEEIEKEISRLWARLEVLRLEKAERNAKLVKKCGDGKKYIEETKIRRRGVSLGPSEIIAGVKSGRLGKQESITPAQPLQSRRKSCFWKLQDIDEEVTKSRKSICRIQGSRQAFTTVGLRKTVKKEDGILASIQPKKLFKEGERSVPAKKQLKPGRIIASRYNQSTGNNNSAVRKRSLPENCENESKMCEKKRATSVGKSRNENRVKKLWEIPREVVVHNKLEGENSPISVTVSRNIMLPRIRTARYTNGTPRDSGPAKRVAELVGRKSYFCSDEEGEQLVCQALSFAEAVEEK